MSRLIKKEIVDALSAHANYLLEYSANSCATKLWDVFKNENLGLVSLTRDYTSAIIDIALLKQAPFNLRSIAENKKLLNTKEVSILIGKTEGAVRNLVYQGRLTPKAKKWNTNYFDKDDVLKTILASEEGG